MTITPNPAQELPQRAGAKIINGPWPTYTQFKGLPERERWTIYELAKLVGRPWKTRASR